MDVAKLSKSPKEGLRKAKSLSSPLRTTVKTRLGPDSDAIGRRTNFIDFVYTTSFFWMGCQFSFGDFYVSF